MLSQPRQSYGAILALKTAQSLHLRCQSEVKEMSSDAANKTEETIDRAKEYGERMVNQGRDTFRQYTNGGLDYANEVTNVVSDLVKRSPLLVAGAAFAMGYLAAHLLRRTA